jgi:hypothetical protein
MALNITQVAIPVLCLVLTVFFRKKETLPVILERELDAMIFEDLLASLEGFYLCAITNFHAPHRFWRDTRSLCELALAHANSNAGTAYERRNGQHSYEIAQPYSSIHSNLVLTKSALISTKHFPI